MKELFKEVNVEKVSDKIADQLESLIKEGKLVPGEKLPSERQLIDILGVGRSSLREALNKLETMGYVEIRKRKGIFVKSIDGTMQLDPLKKIMQADRKKIVQLYEVRSDIEQFAAREAALKRTSENLDEIEACLQAFEPEPGVFAFSWQMDQAFHTAIARASQNFFRIHVVMNIFELSREFIQPIIEDLADTDENISVIVRQHTEIFRAIQNKDTENARACMQKHLGWTNQILIGHFQ